MKAIGFFGLKCGNFYFDLVFVAGLVPILLASEAQLYFRFVPLPANQK